MDIERTVRLIGWASIGLGLAELFSSRPITRSLGIEDKGDLVRSYGVREISSGIGLLRNRRPTHWMWGRVAGDVADVATLAPALRRDNPQRACVLAVLAGLVGILVLDVAVARTLDRTP